MTLNKANIHLFVAKVPFFTKVIFDLQYAMNLGTSLNRNQTMNFRAHVYQISSFAIVAFCITNHLSSLRSDEPDIAKELRPFADQYCVQCHGVDQVEANLHLERLISDWDVIGDFKSWEKVIQVLQTNRMPPEGSLQPKNDERDRHSKQIHSTIERAIERNAGDPGPVVMRRLTSAEYSHSIESVTGLDLGLERIFVNDAVGGEGFTNVGGAQFMQDSALEQYLALAKKVADHAMIGAGPLKFFSDTGQTGRELSAIDRIQRIYRQHGFRTAAGEGANPFGLDLYPRAFLVAWRYLHREKFGKRDVSLDQLAAAEGLSQRFCRHVWNVLNGPSNDFPLSMIVELWRKLPSPSSEKPGVEPRSDCDQIARVLREWQKVLAAASGNEEEASVLTAGDVHLETKHPFNATINWEAGSQFAEFELSVTSASPNDVSDAMTIWKNSRIRFRAIDGRRGEGVSLRSCIAPDTIEQLQFGRHPVEDVVIDADDFVLGGDKTILLRLLVPADMQSARLTVEVELDVKHASNRIVRCRIADHSVEGKTVASVGATSTLLGDPTSDEVSRWQVGVAEFAMLMPEVSQREPAPSDRDPIPLPFDSTYNMPERNHFHTAIKYHRDDRFLVENILDDATRRELDEAWTDLLTSFEYHDLNWQFVAKKFGIQLPESRVADLDQKGFSLIPDETQAMVVRIRDEYLAMMSQLELAQPVHLNNAIELAQHAWRRPLSSVEERQLRDFYQQLRRDEKLEHTRAMRSLITRILVSPAFLYLAEPTSESAGVVPLTDWELASRLSYFLWSTAPDEELRKMAQDGQLQEEEGLCTQTRRMLRDPKARRLATEFFGQWFGFYRFDTYQGIDSQRFPEFNEGLRSAMYEEAVRFFEHIVREDRPAREILFADYTFLNQPLAQHYGLEGNNIPTSGFNQVIGVNRQHRGGLLGLGAVHAITSAPLRTSAVRRGDWLLRRVFGSPVPPPPADAGSIATDDVLADRLTVRQRLESHRRDASCSSCHSRIDPLGFALENYDSIGRWRDHYRDGQPIDSSGTLSDGTTISGPDSLLEYLRREQSQFERTLSVKLLGYALGRAELATDRPLIDDMLLRLREDGRFSELVLRIVTSRQFRNRRS